MENYGTVQQKISCVFETAVLDEPSGKRDYQQFKVVATDVLKRSATDSDISTALATEKLDGTCVFIKQYNGLPWLWARFDRKPNKNAEKRFRKFQTEQSKGDNPDQHAKFNWNPLKDFKQVPDDWIPADGIEIVDGFPQPDDIGHTPGWVPVDPKCRQHCWHLSAVNLNKGVGLFLRQDEEEISGRLLIEALPLSELEGCTAELIGTNINANPYGIGSKKCPIHLLVVHGAIMVSEPPAVDGQVIREWFKTSKFAAIEGLVWHCRNKKLFKLHRHHINQTWPIKMPTLASRKVHINVDSSKFQLNDTKSLLCRFSEHKGQVCDSLQNLQDIILPEDNVRKESD
ncbi:hypothetical protein CHS0354_040897 [Potamilus streckersoni]|uniref:RNA ligase 1 n=1 Tax=Potamilus streckersoni TaxID=2493646 RepID=A0AAE0SLV5_9BIVA|nr:hypothetical protein CHS0354_040897 [Potamilus streckersoni]